MNWADKQDTHTYIINNSTNEWSGRIKKNWKSKVESGWFSQIWLYHYFAVQHGNSVLENMSLSFVSLIILLFLTCLGFLFVCIVLFRYSYLFISPAYLLCTNIIATVLKSDSMLQEDCQYHDSADNQLLGSCHNPEGRGGYPNPQFAPNTIYTRCIQQHTVQISNLAHYNCWQTLVRGLLTQNHRLLIIFCAKMLSCKAPWWL